MLTQKSILRVDELSDRYGISEVTIRKDLRYLEEKGELIRGRGTVRLIPEKPAAGTACANVLQERMEMNSNEKLRIITEAEKMVNDWDVVLLAPGSTSCMLAKELAKRRNVIIVTTAVLFASEIPEPQARVIYLGGEYNSRFGATSGTFVMEALNAINIDKFFIGANGVIANVGVTSYDFDGMLINMMIDRSKEVILLADHTKFGRANALTVLDIKNIDTVITGSELSPDIQDELRRSVQQVVLV